eukprot:g2025.t1
MAQLKEQLIKKGCSAKILNIEHGKCFKLLYDACPKVLNTDRIRYSGFAHVFFSTPKRKLNDERSSLPECSVISSSISPRQRKLMANLQKSQNRIKVIGANRLKDEIIAKVQHKALTREMGNGADVNPNILRRMLSKYAEKKQNNGKPSNASTGFITKENFAKAMNANECLDVGGTINDLHEVYDTGWNARREKNIAIETRTVSKSFPQNESSKLGVGSAEAAKLYYRRDGGGLHAKRSMSLNAAKPPNTTRFRRESLVGMVLHEDSEKRPIISNHQATIGATSQMQWPRKEIQIKLASQTSDAKGPLHHKLPRNCIYNVYGAVQNNVPSRPSTSYASSNNSRRGESPRQTPINRQVTTPPVMDAVRRNEKESKLLVTSGTQTSTKQAPLKLVPYWKDINNRRAMTAMVSRRRREGDIRRRKLQRKVQTTRNAIPTYKNASPRREHIIAKLNHEKMLKARQAAIRASSRQRSRTGTKFTSLSGAY